MLFDDVVKSFTAAGLPTFEVGGAVRDHILGVPCHDRDIMVAADSLEKITSMTVPNSTCLMVGAAYGIVVFVRGEEKVDVALPRKDVSYGEDRKDCVIAVVTDPVEDLSRRDFTINAMALNCVTGELLDPFGGREDIKKRVICCVGNPLERFLDEDPLRVLRAFSFAARFGFLIEEKTLAAMSDPEVLRKLRDEISGERKRDELLKILATRRAADVLELMAEVGVLQVILPEVTALMGMPYVKKYHTSDPFYHTMESMRAYGGSDVVINLAILLHDIGKYKTLQPNHSSPRHAKVGAEMVMEIAARLKLTNQLRDEVAFLVGSHMDMLQDKAALARKLKRATGDGATTLERAFMVRRADTMGRGSKSCQDTAYFLDSLYRDLKALQEQDPTLMVRDLDISGHDLKEKGVKPGPIMGRMLNCLLSLVIDEKVKNDKDTLLTYV